MKGLSFTDNGLEIPTFEELYQDTIDKIKQIYGDDYYIDPESPDAQLVSTIIKNQWDMAQVLQLIFKSFYPNTATGAALDRVCSYQGITRNEPTQSTCTVMIYGENESKVPAGSIFADVNGALWNLSNDVTITNMGWVEGAVTSVDYGIFAGIGEITNIVEAPDTVTKVYNAVPCNQGTEEETDSQLRSRRKSLVMLSTKSVTEGILAAISEQTGVVKATIYENDEPYHNGIIPANSIGVSVLGGINDAIAKAIAYKKTPGCATVGTILVPVLQQNNELINIKFYRPQYVKCELVFNLEILDGFSTSTSQLIADACSEYISSLNIGESCLIGKLYQLAYKVSPTEQLSYNVTSIVMKMLTGIDAETEEEIYTVQANKMNPGPFNLLAIKEDGVVVNV